MSKHKHTPGLWEIELTGDHKRYIIGSKQSRRGTNVAEVYNDDIDPDEAMANASLISAAPDLLGALESLLETKVSGGRILSSQWASALWAIKRATRKAP